MDDGGILFNETTWKTHILTASAAIVYETLIEHGGGNAVTATEARDALRNVLDLDPDTPDITQLLAMLETLGVIRG
ncbi:MULTISPECIES: HPr-rel-A system PqqD family peptide chaperone [unclassified Ectothiorhodospira]|uniref:HPr-rel-A system PqqD family peptide chaperone n=1 Tax=unclassified Ectothiorhodospira TaxID=2684909 RepID=UPI001EE7E1E2|nr:MULTISPECIES: HPr-rel-A system PqqD family peptide chaperone [unclassified Ectothiorhodospira]MCG5517322.1 HPr-rel-A system PqqD family peptide chaperone [Ectothiorhodospira sp. 9100]MCG5520017.1 HPr-rel-A system PqqD family peptide chaperone [Ectothiorhodospira sp. 9905]